jgi:hypothetical protein
MRRPQIDLERPVPVLDLQVIERLGLVNGRHVHEHVQPSERRRGGVDHATAGDRVREVRLHDERAPAERADCRGGRIGFSARSIEDQRNVSAARRQRQRDVGADALSAGDDDAAARDLHKGSG